MVLSYQFPLVFHRLIWFKLYPWVVTISFEILENTRLHIWDPLLLYFYLCLCKISAPNFAWKRILCVGRLCLLRTPKFQGCSDTNLSPWLQLCANETWPFNSHFSWNKQSTCYRFLLKQCTNHQDSTSNRRSTANALCSGQLDLLSDPRFLRSHLSIHLPADHSTNPNSPPSHNAPRSS